MQRVLEVVSNQLNTKLSYNNDTLFQDAKSLYTKLIVNIVIIFAHSLAYSIELFFEKNIIIKLMLSIRLGTPNRQKLQHILLIHIGSTLMSSQ